ncbi:MAG: hypothetical protein NXI31_12470 [bacterium]|nr:hypothetical protein [bacterium]
MLLLVAAIGVTSAPASAQWRTEQIREVQLEVDAPERLERLPMRLGERGVHHRARLMSKDRNDMIRARYTWQADVYEFSKKGKKKGKEIDLPDGTPPEMAKQIREAMMRFGAKSHKSFKEWLDAQEGVGIVQKGKKRRGRNGKADYTHWVWRLDNQWGPAGQCWCEAAVYDFGEREVAFVIEMPVEKLNAKPKSKWKAIIKKMMRSGKKLDDGDLAKTDPGAKKRGDKARDKFADSPGKLAALKKAKENIAGLDGWDYFTSPNYIVLYSWDFSKPSERTKSKKQAEYYTDRLEKMRKLYVESFPLDDTGLKAVWPDVNKIPKLEDNVPITGPRTEDKGPTVEEIAAKAKKAEGKVPYSVFRLCATYDQFSKYGGTSGGVVGWYSPGSKELVVFLGGDKMMGKGATETVTFHEGWHQYADLYFHHPASPKHASLHRWFDEGHGDYFGSFRWSNAGWKYVGSKMRHESCKNMVRVGDYIPFKELVKWPRRLFYTNRPAYRYAQAYSMIDFFRRGQKQSGFKQRWGEALGIYGNVAIAYGDTTKGVDIAFREMTDEDWRELEDAWKTWVGSKHFLNGQ